MPGDVIHVYMTYTKVIIWITRFPSCSGLRGILVMNCKILPHRPNWMQTCCVFLIIILDSLLLTLQIIHPNKGNSRKKPRIAQQDSVERMLS